MLFSRRVGGVLGFVAIFTLLAAVGCGPPEVAGRPVRVPVKGIVTQKGIPVSSATVVFVPTAHDHGAAGMTNEAGEFTLQTFDPGDGAVPGRYQITIRKVEMVPGRAAASSEGGSGEGGDAEPQVATIEKFITPEKYSKVDTSGLSEEVKDSGPNEFKFDLL